MASRSVVVFAVLSCSTVILTLCPYAYGRKPDQRNVEFRPEARCGDELQIKTQDGTTYQGKLLTNNGYLLALRHGRSGLQSVALEDVANAFCVKRRTGRGILVGSAIGTGVGLIAAVVVNHNRRQKRGFFQLPYEIEEKVAIFVLIPLAGGIVGGSVGGIIGHRIQRLGPVQLEALPMCTSPSGDKIPIKVNLAVDF